MDNGLVRAGKYPIGVMHGVNARSTRRTTRIDADIGVEARISFWVRKKLLPAVIGAEIILPVLVRSPELCRILINDCKTDRIRSHAKNTRLHPVQELVLRHGPELPDIVPDKVVLPLDEVVGGQGFWLAEK